MRDFTLYKYRELLQGIIKAEYSFVTDVDAFKSGKKVILMRHDIDVWPENALKMAKLEHKLGVKAMYYFRMKKCSFDPEIILQIKNLGHEIGYHYEELSDTKGNIAEAYELFKNNLNRFRELLPITTIVMHGRALSRWDSKKIWEKYSYKDLGIEFEPYFDIDFNEVKYYTDTGGMWDGDKYSIRDFVKDDLKIQVHTTNDFIDKINKGIINSKLHLTVHPDRWNDNLFVWLFVFFRVNVKNIPKMMLKNLRAKR